MALVCREIGCHAHVARWSLKSSRRLVASAVLTAAAQLVRVSDSSVASRGRRRSCAMRAATLLARWIDSRAPSQQVSSVCMRARLCVANGLQQGGGLATSAHMRLGATWAGCFARLAIAFHRNRDRPVGRAALLAVVVVAPAGLRHRVCVAACVCVIRACSVHKKHTPTWPGRTGAHRQRRQPPAAHISRKAPAPGRRDDLARRRALSTLSRRSSLLPLKRGRMTTTASERERKRRPFGGAAFSVDFIHWPLCRRLFQRRPAPIQFEQPRRWLEAIGGRKRRARHGQLGRRRAPFWNGPIRTRKWPHSRGPLHLIHCRAVELAGSQK
jgi:hypothetical protein